MKKLLIVNLLFATLMVAVCVTPASAMIVNATAFGDQLAGATLTVTYQSNIVATGVIGAGPAAQEGSVVVPARFSFSVIGDTFVGLWNLTNLKPDDFITMADFFLPPSLSLFDDNSTPSTPNSAAGRAGAVWVSGPVIAASAEYAPWPDIQNLGDMYLGEEIFWATQTFPFNTTCSWEDDTDYIPEPATLCLLALGGLLLRRRKNA